MTNFATSADVYCDVEIVKNNVSFIDYLSLDAGATAYPLSVGRVNTANTYSKFICTDNYFEESSAITVTMEFTEYEILDLLRNRFVGTYSLDMGTDNLAAVPTSRFICTDNLVVGAVTPTVTNVNAIVSKLIRNNSSELDFGFAVTDTLKTIGVFYDDATSQFKAWDGAAFKVVAVV
jgi:hypothetical protein